MNISTKLPFPIFAALICAAALLASCGGGSGGEVDLAKYTGNWSSPCISVNGRQSLRQIWEIKEVHGSDIGGSKISTLYGNTTCNGKAHSEVWYHLAGNKAGARQTNAGASDMLMLTYSNPNGSNDPGAEAQLWLLKDGALYMGDKSNMAPDGYPADVDLSIAYTRQ